MCAIAGLISGECSADFVQSLKPKFNNILEQMLEQMAARGPDARFMRSFETSIESSVFLGANRLAINGLKSGAQPYFSADGKVCAVFNGEIYNHFALRRSLNISSADSIESDLCDGDILPALWQKYGIESFCLLDGMFAIAILDLSAKKLILARDIAGEKPLYFSANAELLKNFRNLDSIKNEVNFEICNADYSRFAQTFDFLPPKNANFKDIESKKMINFAFASTATALKAAHSEFSLSKRAVWDYFSFGFVPQNLCIFEQIAPLPRGCALVLDLQKKEIYLESFAQKTLQNFAPFGLYKDSMTGIDCIESANKILEQKSDLNLVEITKNVVENATSARLMSEVGVGCCLSGGLDSSIISALCTRKLGTLQTFNIAFSQGVNESEFAKKVSQKIGSKHHEIVVDETSYRAVLGQFIENCDEPYGVISGLGVALMALCARENGLRVLLSGDGADEIFGGYSWYPKLAFSDPNFINEQKPKGWHYYAFECEKMEILNPLFFTQDSIKKLDSRIYFPPINAVPRAFIDFDREFYLPYEMMRKLDRFSALASVEGRAVFIAPSVWALGRSLSYERLLKHGGKWLLKEAFKELLPREVLERSKWGFNPPSELWLNGEAFIESKSGANFQKKASPSGFGAWLDLLEEALLPNSALNKCQILAPNARAKLLKIAKESRFSNIAFFIISLNLWLNKHFLGENL